MEATKSEVFKILTSEKFNLEKALATKSKVVDFIQSNEITGVQTVLIREFDREIPEIARSFIGKQFQAKEIFTWDSSCEQAEIEIQIEKAPLKISGQIKLVEIPPKTSIEIELAIKAGVPFFGEKIERFAEKVWENISRDEIKRLKDHFRPQI